MKRAKKAVSILVTLCMMLSLLAPAAFADTKTGPKQVLKITDGDDTSLGQLLIVETDATKGSVEEGDLITITLPDGVEFEESVTEDTYTDIISFDTAWGQADDATSAITDMSFVAGSKKFVTLQVADVDYDLGHKAYFVVDFANDAALVDVSSSVKGDVKITVETTGGGFIEGDYTVARVGSGGAVITVMDDPSVAAENGVAIGEIKITEIAAGSLEEDANDPIKVVLPKDVEYTDATDAVGYGSLAGNISVDFDDDDTLEITITGESEDSPGFIIVSPVVDIDKDFEGDLEVEVKGNEITSTKAVIAHVGDFDLSVKAEDEIPTVIAGQNDQEIADLTISEKIAASWVPNRKVDLELPGDVEWEDLYSCTDLDVVSSDADEMSWTIEDPTDEEEDFDLENATVNVPVDTPVGDLKIKIDGSAGLEAEVVVAKVVAPITATATTPELKIGLQGQVAGDITIKEAAEGVIQLDADNELDEIWVTLPAGVTFAAEPKVEVTSGDFEVDDVELTDGDSRLVITVDEESNEASTIKITDVKLDVDRTVAVGAVKAEIGGPSLDEFGVIEEEDEDGSVDGDDAESAVAKVVIGNVVTPSQGSSAIFTIGSAIYNVNGVAQVMDAAPYIKDGRTYVPVRYLAYTMGITEENIGFENGVVTLTKGEEAVKLTIGSKTLTNGESVVEMDVAPEVVNGRTMLPARFVAEAFGATVGFANGQVVINK